MLLRLHFSLISRVKISFVNGLSKMCICPCVELTVLSMIFINTLTLPTADFLCSPLQPLSTNNFFYFLLSRFNSSAYCSFGFRFSFNFNSNYEFTISSAKNFRFLIHSHFHLTPIRFDIVFSFFFVLLTGCCCFENWF